MQIFDRRTLWGMSLASSKTAGELSATSILPNTRRALEAQFDKMEFISTVVSRFSGCKTSRMKKQAACGFPPTRNEEFV